MGIQPTKRHSTQTIKGNWEPIISTEEFEQGAAILKRRNEHRTVKRKQEYLLTGLIYFRQPNGKLRRLTGSTSNARRTNGGTPYYRIAERGGPHFMCRFIDDQIAEQMKCIQVDPKYLPGIRAAYTEELRERCGHNKPDLQGKLEEALKQISQEEARMARHLATGKISDDVWESLWAEWQDRRQTIQRTLQTAQQEHSTHVTNLEHALQLIAKLGTLYNELDRSTKKQLLRDMVERVVVDCSGNVTLELHPPFAYLKSLSEDVKGADVPRKGGRKATKNGGGFSSAASPEVCLQHLQISSTGCSQSEQVSELSVPKFLGAIAYPQREQLPLSLT